MCSKERERERENKKIMFSEAPPSEGQQSLRASDGQSWRLGYAPALEPVWRIRSFRTLGFRACLGFRVEGLKCRISNQPRKPRHLTIHCKEYSYSIREIIEAPKEVAKEVTETIVQNPEAAKKAAKTTAKNMRNATRLTSQSFLLLPAAADKKECFWLCT